MDNAHLVQMANRIGQFFEAMPDAAEAQAEAAQHLRKFWTPAMRADLLAHIDAQTSASADLDADGLRPFMRQAVLLHRALLTPAAGAGA
jgi:formate dehydrogenase subunit delta